MTEPVVKESLTPTPGSEAASKAGCTCPIMDNHYGAGFGREKLFYISGDCPLHAVKRSNGND